MIDITIDVGLLLQNRPAFVDSITDPQGLAN